MRMPFNVSETPGALVKMEAVNGKSNEKDEKKNGLLRGYYFTLFLYFKIADKR